MSKRDGDFKESWSGGEPSNYKEWKSLGLTNKERGQVLRRRIRAKTNRERRKGKSRSRIQLEAFARRHGIDPFGMERPCDCCNGTGKQRLEKSFDTIHREAKAKHEKKKAERKSWLDKKFRESDEQ
tara:strand:- start:7298 stop:7675 length:378 start_codon:yes stop_codon:yes gene_type:complete